MGATDMPSSRGRRVAEAALLGVGAVCTQQACAG